MNQMSLKKLEFDYGINSNNIISDIPFSIYSGAIDCLGNLLKLKCRSEIFSEFFEELSKICHNIQLLDIYFLSDIPNGLLNLISVQQNLKNFRMFSDYGRNLTTLLTTLPNTIIKLDLYGGRRCMPNIPLSFITNFTNLQELYISSHPN